MSNGEWRSTEVVAWTEREGPGRPPPGASSGMWTATAATLGVVLSVIFMTDALCPEHRMWVQSLAMLALLGSITAIVGLARGWAGAPFLTIGVAAIGMVIGAIDAAHAPVRGGVIGLGFLLALVFSGWLAIRQLPVTAWDRRVRRDAKLTFPEDAPATAPAATAPPLQTPANEEALTSSD